MIALVFLSGDNFSRYTCVGKLIFCDTSEFLLEQPIRNRLKMIREIIVLCFILSTDFMAISIVNYLSDDVCGHRVLLNDSPEI